MASAWLARIAACYVITGSCCQMDLRCSLCVCQVVGQTEAAEQAEGGDGQASFLTFRLQDLVAGGEGTMCQDFVSHAEASQEKWRTGNPNT